MDTRSLEYFKPDRDALLTRASRYVNEHILRHVASADYGSDVEQHYAKLLAIRDLGQFDRPLRWHPREVLELTRWSEPEALNRSGRKCELIGAAGHWARLFCCAALLRAYCDAESREVIIGGMVEALAQLIESILQLPEVLHNEAMASLSWGLINVTDDPEFSAFGSAALLIISSRVDGGKFSEKVLVSLCDWVKLEEQRAYNVWGRGVGNFPENWLLRTSHFTLCGNKWLSFGELLRTHKAKGKVGSTVREIGRLLSGQQMPG